MIGQRIKEARLKLGYSAEQVAAFLNVSPATVYRYENGDISKLPSKFIKPLAEYLCVSPSWLMGWSSDEEYQRRWAEYRDSQEPPDVPRTEEARILAKGIDKLPPEQREQALAVVRAMFVKYADYFDKENDHDA